MYKNYDTEDYVRVADECAERIRKLLNDRYAELEEFRDAINDRYPFEDLFLKWAEVDDEEELLRRLLSHLDICSAELKDNIRKSGEENPPHPEDSASLVNEATYPISGTPSA